MSAVAAAHERAYREVMTISHENTATVPAPGGDT